MFISTNDHSLPEKPNYYINLPVAIQVMISSVMTSKTMDNSGPSPKSDYMTMSPSYITKINKRVKKRSLQ